MFELMTFSGSIHFSKEFLYYIFGLVRQIFHEKENIITIIFLVKESHNFLKTKGPSVGTSGLAGGNDLVQSQFVS